MAQATRLVIKYADKCVIDEEVMEVTLKPDLQRFYRSKVSYRPQNTTCETDQILSCFSCESLASRE